MAHDIVNCARTNDVVSNIDILFENDTLIEQDVRRGLLENGFIKESPIQMAAFPYVLNDYDAIVQSKSGTGKSIVFVTAALNKLVKLPVQQTQTIILAPTREIAVQITDVIRSVGVHVKNLNVDYFIGGTQVERPKHPVQIAVGSPGRIKQLIHLGHLSVDAVRLFILDEADKLINTGFVQDITWIYSKLPAMKQMLVVSATYSDENFNTLQRYMIDPHLIRPADAATPLLGVTQCLVLMPECKNPVLRSKAEEAKLIQLLSQTPFTQCVIFSNYQLRPDVICEQLAAAKFNSVFLSGAQEQTSRLASLDAFKRGKVRILVTTDLAARGIDAANVDLVINLEIPHDTATYLHRMGRAGRYGTRGLVITIVQNEAMMKFHNFMQAINQSGTFNIWKVPDRLDGTPWTQRVEALLSGTRGKVVGENAMRVRQSDEGGESEVLASFGGENQVVEGFEKQRPVEEGKALTEVVVDSIGEGNSVGENQMANGAVEELSGEDNRDVGKVLNEVKSDETLAGKVGLDERQDEKDGDPPDGRNGPIGNETDVKVGDANENKAGDINIVSGKHTNENGKQRDAAINDSSNHENDKFVGNELVETNKTFSREKKRNRQKGKRGKALSYNGGSRQSVSQAANGTDGFKIIKDYGDSSPVKTSLNTDTVVSSESKDLEEKVAELEESKVDDSKKLVDFDLIFEFVNQSPSASEAERNDLNKVPNCPDAISINEEQLKDNLQACLDKERDRFENFAKKLDHIDAEALADWILNKHNNVAALFGNEEANTNGNDAKSSGAVNSSSDTITNEKVGHHARELKSYDSLSLFSPAQTTLNEHDLENEFKSGTLKQGRKQNGDRSLKNKENTNILNTPTKKRTGQTTGILNFDDNPRARSCAQKMPARDLVVYDEIDMFSPAANNLDEYEVDYVGQDGPVRETKSSRESLHHNDSLDIKMRKKLKGNRLQRGKRARSDQDGRNEVTPAGKSNAHVRRQEPPGDLSEAEGAGQRRPSNDDTDFVISWENEPRGRESRNSGQASNDRSDDQVSKGVDKDATIKQVARNISNGNINNETSLNQAYEANFSHLNESCLDFTVNNDAHFVFLPNSSTDEEDLSFFSPENSNEDLSETNSPLKSDAISGGSLNSSAIDLHCDALDTTADAEDYKRYRVAAKRREMEAKKQEAKATGRGNEADEIGSLDYKGYRAWRRDMDLCNVSTNVNVSDDDGVNESYNVLKTPTPLKHLQPTVRGRPTVSTSLFSGISSNGGAGMSSSREAEMCRDGRRRIAPSDVLLRKAVLKNDFLKRQAVDNVHCWRTESLAYPSAPFASNMSNSFNFDTSFSNLTQNRVKLSQGKSRCFNLVNRSASKASRNVPCPSNIYDAGNGVFYTSPSQHARQSQYSNRDLYDFDSWRKHCADPHHFNSSSPHLRKHGKKNLCSSRSKLACDAFWSSLEKDRRYPKEDQREINSGRIFQENPYNSSVFDARQVSIARRVGKLRGRRNLDETFDSMHTDATYESAHTNRTYTRAHNPDEEAYEIEADEQGYEDSDFDNVLGQDVEIEEDNSEEETINENAVNTYDKWHQEEDEADEGCSDDSSKSCTESESDEIIHSHSNQRNPTHSTGRPNHSVDGTTETADQSSPQSGESSYKSISSYSMLGDEPNFADMSWRSVNSGGRDGENAAVKAGRNCGGRRGENSKVKAIRNVGGKKKGAAVDCRYAGKETGRTERDASREPKMAALNSSPFAAPMPSGWTKVKVEEFESGHDKFTTYNDGNEERDFNEEEYNEDYYNEDYCEQVEVYKSKKDVQKHSKIVETMGVNSKNAYGNAGKVSRNRKETARNFQETPYSSVAGIRPSRSIGQTAYSHVQKSRHTRAIPVDFPRNYRRRESPRQESVTSENETYLIDDSEREYRNMYAEDKYRPAGRDRYRNAGGNERYREPEYAQSKCSSCRNRNNAFRYHSNATDHRYHSNATSTQTLTSTASGRSYSLSNGLAPCPYENMLRANPSYYPGLDIEQMRRSLDRQKAFMEVYLGQMNLYVNVGRNVACDSRLEL